jgi:Xaa-Pro aminopeptidase
MISGRSPAVVNAAMLSDALERLGLRSARIGLCGTFAGVEELRSSLPDAQIDAAAVEDDAGTKRDPVELERARTKSPWEVARMERAQELVELGAHTFASSLVAGAKYSSVLAEIEYRMKLAGAEEVFVPASRGSAPLGSYSLPGWLDGKYEDGETIAFEINARVEGYWAQLPRTWVVGGKPSPAQQRLHEATVRGFEAMRDRLEVGVTGSELWEVGLAPIEAAGFQPWGRFGHGMGLTQTEWFSVLGGDKSRVQEGQSIIIHASAIDKDTGAEALIGEQFVLEDGQPRLLSQTGAPIGLDLVPPAD